jgi:hypothetical protein
MTTSSLGAAEKHLTGTTAALGMRKATAEVQEEAGRGIVRGHRLGGGKLSNSTGISDPVKQEAVRGQAVTHRQRGG